MSMEFDTGSYTAKILDQGFATAKTGNQQFFLTIEPIYEGTGSEVTELPRQLRGKKRTIFRTITDNTVERFAQDLRSLGYTGDSFDGVDPETKGFHSFKDQEVPVVCKENSFGGNVNERWELEFSGGFTAVRSEKKAIRELSAKYKSVLKNAKPLATPPEAKPERTVRPAAAAAANGHARGDAAEDDVPF